MGSNKIIAISAPSGAGKSRACAYALDRYGSQLGFSISANSRKRRPHEKDGVHYHFMPGVTAAERAANFKLAVGDGKLLEWQQVYDNDDGYRGTLVSEIPRIWGEGKIPLLDLDVEGAINLKLNLYPTETTCIFIDPASLAMLERVLRERTMKDGADPDKIEDRIRKAPLEIARTKDVGRKVFEHVLRNNYDDFFFNEVDNCMFEILGVVAPFR